MQNDYILVKINQFLPFSPAFLFLNPHGFGCPFQAREVSDLMENLKARCLPVFLLLDTQVHKKCRTIDSCLCNL